MHIPHAQPGPEPETQPVSELHRPSVRAVEVARAIAALESSLETESETPSQHEGESEVENPSGSSSTHHRSPVSVRDIAKAIANLGEKQGSTLTKIRHMLEEQSFPVPNNTGLRRLMLRGIRDGRIRLRGHKNRFTVRATAHRRKRTKRSRSKSEKPKPKKKKKKRIIKRRKKKRKIRRRRPRRRPRPRPRPRKRRVRRRRRSRRRKKRKGRRVKRSRSKK